MDSYTKDDAMSLLAKGAFIKNAKASFVEFSISIKDRIKYLVLKGLNIRFKCDIIDREVKFALQLVKDTRKLCLFIY